MISLVIFRLAGSPAFIFAYTYDVCKYTKKKINVRFFFGFLNLPIVDGSSSAAVLIKSKKFICTLVGIVCGEATTTIQYTNI